jgi:hypothetical protein
VESAYFARIAHGMRERAYGIARASERGQGVHRYVQAGVSRGEQRRGEHLAEQAHAAKMGGVGHSCATATSCHLRAHHHGAHKHTRPLTPPPPGFCRPRGGPAPRVPVGRDGLLP